MALGPTGRRIVAWLRQHGPVHSTEGRATGRLAYALEVDHDALLQALRLLERRGLVRRTITGKRCYRIALPEHDIDHCTFCSTSGSSCAIHRRRAHGQTTG